MNKNIDIPLEALNNPGNIWINKASKQLRYSLNKSIPSVWLQPLSIYQVGNKLDNGIFLKRGQPVSIGFLDELALEAQDSGAPSVVPTNPHKHQWCIGLALEPGNSTQDNVHVLPYGQIEYHLNCKNPDLVYQPPNENGKYLWTYEDIGKPVMVSNYPGEEGGLTIDITHAYYNGANIVTVGRIADAPISSEVEQKIVLEVNLAGDTRGMIDSTQFSVRLANEVPLDKNGLPIEYIQEKDRLIFVKVIDDIRPGMEKGIGIMVTSDEVLLENGALNSPVGCFLAKSKNGKISLKDYADKDVLLHRLGIVESKFNFEESEVGKDLFFSNGQLSTVFNSTAYEYKVGVVLDKNRVLVDCRYPKQFMKSEMVGKIKLAYTDKLTQKPISDPGYVIIDPTVVHKVKGAWDQDTQYKLVDFSTLVETIMHQDIIQYSDNEAGPFENISGDTTFKQIENGYFKFKNVFYSVENGTVATQIKFSNEGAPDNIQYLWPEQAFEKTIDPANGNTVVWNEDNSPIRCNINHLYNLGAYTGGGGNLLESYDIICKAVINDKESRYITPGFYSYKEGAKEKWCGFEWAIINNKVANQWQIVMITDPNVDNIFSSIPETDILGFCFPAGKPLLTSLKLLITIRRRPIQYHNLFLNQLASNNPWKPMTDGTGNLVTDQTLYFGEMYTSGSASDPVWTLKREGSNSVTFNNYQKTNNIYKKLLKYSIGPYVDVGLSEPKLVNQLIVEYVPVSYEQNPIQGKSIKWIYDFKDNYASLNADFGAKLITPPTTKDTAGAATEEFVEVYEDYVQGQTNANPKGDYDYPRSALQTLHEVPIQFFNYIDDNDKTHKRISTVQESWNEVPGNIQRYQPQNISREIFPPKSDGSYANGTQYKYTTNLNSEVSKKGEWEHIQEEIGYLFNPLKRNTLGEIESGGDITYIQTNLGLLNRAIRETQERLLKLERSSFGADYYTIPGNKIPIQGHYSFSDALSDDGILRRMKHLIDIGLFTSIGEPKNGGITFPFYSDYKTIIWDMFGDYYDEESYKEGALKNHLQYDYKSHFHKVYLWWLQNNGNRGNQYHIPPNDVDLTHYPQSGKLKAMYDSRRIFFNKYFDGYYTEGKNGKLPQEKHPFLWPITGVNLEDRFFNSTIFGMSDDVVEEIIDNSGQSTQIEHRSIDNLSLEGVMWDIMSKLSWVKNTTDSNSQQYHKNYVNMYPRNITFPIANEDKVSLKRSFREIKNSINLEDFHSTSEQQNIKIYSSFSLIEGKLHNTYTLSIKSTDSIKNSTNPDRTTHPYIDIRSKELKLFEYARNNKVSMLNTAIQTKTVLPGLSPIENDVLIPLNAIVLVNVETRTIYAWVFEEPYNPSTYYFAILDETGDYIKCLSIPTGWYIPWINNINLCYFINKGPANSEIYSSYNILPPSNMYTNEVYFHFPSGEKGKKSFSSKQYIESLKDFNLNLGYFVLGDGFPKKEDKNKWWLEERNPVIAPPPAGTPEPPFTEVSSIKYLKFIGDESDKPIVDIGNFETKVNIPTIRKKSNPFILDVTLPKYRFYIDKLRGLFTSTDASLKFSLPEIYTSILQNDSSTTSLFGEVNIPKPTNISSDINISPLSFTVNQTISLEEKEITLPAETVEFKGMVNGVETFFKNKNDIVFKVPGYDVPLNINSQTNQQTVACILNMKDNLKGTAEIKNLKINTIQTELDLKSTINASCSIDVGKYFEADPMSSATTNFDIFTTALEKELDTISGIVGIKQTGIETKELRLNYQLNQHPVTLNITGKNIVSSFLLKSFLTKSGKKEKVVDEQTGYIFIYDKLRESIENFNPTGLESLEDNKHWKAKKHYIMETVLPEIKTEFINRYGEKECLYQYRVFPDYYPVYEEKSLFGGTLEDTFTVYIISKLIQVISSSEYFIPSQAVEDAKEKIKFFVQNTLIFYSFVITESGIYAKNDDLGISTEYQNDTSVFDKVSGAMLAFSGRLDYSNKDLEDLLAGKNNSPGIYNVYNSGYIYGKHLTDNVDMNIALKKEKIGDSLSLVLNEKKHMETSIYAYTEDDIKQLQEKSISITYTNAFYIEINEKEVPVFKDYSYSVFKRLEQQDKLGLPIIKNVFVGIVDSNIIVLTGVPTQTIELFIVPGICTNLKTFDAETSLYLDKAIPQGALKFTYRIKPSYPEGTKSLDYTNIPILVV